MRVPLSLCALSLVGSAMSQNLLCDPAGDLVLYSNYDGGLLNIEVDEDIPGLRIGVVSYEFVKVVVTGPFAGNVIRVDYAGFDGNNDHCGLGTLASTTIGGAPNASTTITFAPPVTFANGNGYGSMICAYSCSVNQNQGGCNTADQVAHYFISTHGGSLRYHRTQYGCWQGVQAVSSAGNCCENPLATSLLDPLPLAGISCQADQEADLLRLNGAGANTPLQWQVIDATGRVVLGPGLTHGPQALIRVDALATGVHTLRISDGMGSRALRFVLAR